jgi:hypothetical protein
MSHPASSKPPEKELTVPVLALVTLALKKRASMDGHCLVREEENYVTLVA